MLKERPQVKSNQQQREQMARMKCANDNENIINNDGGVVF